MDQLDQMGLSPSAYPDTFARDHLPPRAQWPVLEFTTDELRYPERLNAGCRVDRRPHRRVRSRPPGPAHA